MNKATTSGFDQSFISKEEKQKLLEEAEAEVKAKRKLKKEKQRLLEMAEEKEKQ